MMLNYRLRCQKTPPFISARNATSCYGLDRGRFLPPRAFSNISTEVAAPLTHSAHKMETTAYVGPTARHSTAMDITQLYAAALGGFVTLFLLTYRLLSVINIHRTGATFYFLKYAFYPPIHRYLSTTRFELFLIVAFLVGNILGVCIDVKDVSELIARSALIFTLNLIPLSFGSHMNLIANTCGVRLPTYARMHRWLGRVAIAEGIAHVAAAVILKRASLRAPKDIAAVIVS